MARGLPPGLNRLPLDCRGTTRLFVIFLPPIRALAEYLLDLAGQVLDQLIAEATALAREIADNNAPVSVAMSRQMLWRMLGADHPMEAHKIDSRAIWARGRQADAKEGVVSFLEKRPANYPDTVSQNMPDFFPWWDERHYK